MFRPALAAIIQQGEHPVHNSKTRTGFLALGATAIMLFAAAPASAGFTAYVIRNSPVINTTATTTEFVIAAGGQKAAFGSNDVNGQTLGSITDLYIHRDDDPTRFAAGSGPATAPYLNFWVTDGTHFAVIANEPSDPDFQPLFVNGTYDLSFADLSSHVAKVFETSDASWLPNGGVNLHFSDLAGLLIMSPTAGEFASQPGAGSGAPWDHTNNLGYGVNWVFGDTLTNYVSGQDGYIVDNDARVSAATAAPEPATIALLGAGLAGFAAARRKRKAA